MTYARRVSLCVTSTSDIVWWWNAARDIWSLAMIARFFISPIELQVVDLGDPCLHPGTS